MKVAVTGGTGFVGSHTVKALLDAGHDVRLLVRNPENVNAALGPLGVSQDSVEVVVADITDRPAIDTGLSGMEGIVHAASLFTFDPRRANEVASTNDTGVRNVLQAAIAAGLDPIIHVSSIVALLRSDGVGDVLTADSDIGDCAYAYLASKSRQEAYARTLQKDGHPVVITQPGAVYGPYDPHDGESQSMVRAAARGLYMLVPPMTIPIVDVRDLAAVHAAAMTPGQGPRRFMAGGTAVRGDELVRHIGVAQGSSIRVFTVPLALARPAGLIGDLARRRGIDLGVSREAMWIGSRRVTVDNSATESSLGVSFRPVEETIADQVEWMADNDRF